jgi:thiol-disulfide isomerase/thioredoxin
MIHDHELVLDHGIAGACPPARSSVITRRTMIMELRAAAGRLSFGADSGVAGNVGRPGAVLPAVTGLVVAVAALLLATATGLWWQARNGKVRARSDLGQNGAGKRGAAKRGAGKRGAAKRGAGGSAAGENGAAESGAGESGADSLGLSSAELGRPLGDRATLVQFSSAFCAPCRATRQVLGEVATMVDGVSHIEIDAESRLDLVRRLDVRRTPTTFVLGPDGHVTHRASGQPRKADVIAVLGAVIEFPTS